MSSYTYAVDDGVFWTEDGIETGRVLVVEDDGHVVITIRTTSGRWTCARLPFDRAQHLAKVIRKAASKPLDRIALGMSIAGSAAAALKAISA